MPPCVCLLLREYRFARGCEFKWCCMRLRLDLHSSDDRQCFASRRCDGSNIGYNKLGRPVKFMSILINTSSVDVAISSCMPWDNQKWKQQKVSKWECLTLKILLKSLDLIICYNIKPLFAIWLLHYIDYCALSAVFKHKHKHKYNRLFRINIYRVAQKSKPLPNDQKNLIKSY